jgi:hypothetical protein
MDNVYKRMVYSYKQPMWHALTKPGQTEETAEEVMERRFQGGFKIEMRPATVVLNGEPTVVKYLAITRCASKFDPNEEIFGFATQRYHVLQPMDVAKTFDANVKQNVETMAFLDGGKDMFISWSMPSFDVVKGDSVHLYGIVRTGFDTLKGTRLFTAIHRPVCENTVNLAEGWAKANSDGNGTGNIWKGKAVNHNLLRDLGYWFAHVQGKAKASEELLKNFLVKLAATPIKTDSEANEILAEAYPYKDDVSAYYPSQLRAAKSDKVEDENQSWGEIRNGIFQLWAGTGTAITRDYWGMFNATSEYFCHVQPSKKPIAQSVMFGGRQNNIQKMVRTLSDRVR